MKLHKTGIGLALGLLTLALNCGVLSQEPPPAPPPDPIGLAGDLVASSQALVKARARSADLADMEKEWKRQRDEHDANRVTYDADKPKTEEAIAYDAEMDRLNALRDKLVARRLEVEGELRTLKTRISVLRMQLKMAKILSVDEAWRDQVVACSKLPNPENAERCLDAAWEHHP